MVLYVHVRIHDYFFGLLLRLVPHDLVRLVGGEIPGEGRVEVFHGGLWGTICHEHWNIDDANVVCRELGYARALSAPGYSTFNNGSSGAAGQVCAVA